MIRFYLIIFIKLICSYIICSTSPIDKLKTALRGNYENVLQLKRGSMIQSRLTNQFTVGNDNGSLSRDAIYYIVGGGYTECSLSQSIIIDLFQTYELNTLTLRLYDLDNRTYNLIVYSVFHQKETIILDCTLCDSITKITFSQRLVDKFRIFNRGGNTYNGMLQIIKVEAYYQYS